MTEATLRDADGALLGRLEAALGPGGVVPPEPRYLEEPRGRYHGRAAAVLRPADVAGVQAAVRLCAEARVGIVPYSGGTGLVGGQVMSEGPLPVLISTERLRAIRDLDVVDDVLVAEAGVILAEAQAAARDRDRLFPLTLASEGSARIGGLLGTNAGGVNVVRYGNARALCLGIEAVMADGGLVSDLTRLHKNNMGYDLRDLLIGSEGTLGVITAASLRLFPIPRERATAWIPVASPAKALDLFHLARERLGTSIEAFELISAQGLAFLAEKLPEVAPPPAPETGWAVLAEVGDGPGSRIADRFEETLGEALERGIAVDALIAQSAAQRDAFWTVRERIPEANRLIGSISSHDISVPLSRLVEFIDRAAAAVEGVAPGLRINCFGHLGDGNLHFNVFPPRGVPRADFDPIRGRVKEAVHDLTHALGGSVSAEHGVGRLKTGDMARYADPGRLAAMRAIKAALDPRGILNPGAVLP
ncbi:MAG: hydroxyacid dehydrogenase [Rhodovulum sulfidophilum]|uniref:Hydroxyacid dehydrogenase n=1 Tax=Rhodovulum sulfidophilum TaxID=35806 RepID=A0A2W5QBN3_RHOSU|nr:MAG: hydroxyacid dehydrogenase [Rhodovulum sulfidophilum]